MTTEKKNVIQCGCKAIVKFLVYNLEGHGEAPMVPVDGRDGSYICPVCLEMHRKSKDNHVSWLPAPFFVSQMAVRKLAALEARAHDMIMRAIPLVTDYEDDPELAPDMTSWVKDYEALKAQLGV